MKEETDKEEGRKKDGEDGEDDTNTHQQKKAQ